mgnify:CR=1 FL=1
MIAVLGMIWAYFHYATDSIFLTPRNLSNLMTQMSVTAILAVGMLMLIVSGNIDLSVGSVLGFAGGIAAGVERIIRVVDGEPLPAPAKKPARGLADGVVITPSHNPAEDGGFKYNPPEGGPADTSVTKWIQDRANACLL